MRCIIFIFSALTLLVGSMIVAVGSFNPQVGSTQANKRLCVCVCVCTHLPSIQLFSPAQHIAMIH